MKWWIIPYKDALRILILKTIKLLHYALKNKKQRMPLTIVSDILFLRVMK